MPILTLRQLLDSGIHYGHRVSRWNPKMRPFIYGKRNLIHILDVRETVRGLVAAYKFVAKVVAQGKDVLFVGTKRQAQMAIRQAAEKCRMPYVCERWLGGTLTNYQVIRRRLARLEELEQLEAQGALEQMTKKEAARIRREIAQIRSNMEGLRQMTRLPGALFVVDPRHERNAVLEANRLGIPTICLLDTDCDPDYCDICIPGNDDAMRAIEIVVNKIADAVLEGRAQRVEPVQPLEPPKDAVESEAATSSRVGRTRSRRQVAPTRMESAPSAQMDTDVAATAPPQESPANNSKEGEQR